MVLRHVLCLMLSWLVVVSSARSAFKSASPESASTRPDVESAESEVESAISAVASVKPESAFTISEITSSKSGVELLRSAVASAISGFARPKVEFLQSTIPSTISEVASARPEVASAKSGVELLRSAVASAISGFAFARPEVESLRSAVPSAISEGASSRPEVSSARPEIEFLRSAVASAISEVASARPEVTSARLEVTSSRPEVTVAVPQNSVTPADAEVVGEAVRKQTFKEAEKEISDFINGLLRSLLPQIVGGSGDAKLTSRCTAGMMKIFANIRRLKGWTVKMLDSMGKPASGILSGTSYSMGDYDQCLNLSITSKGQEARRPDEEMFRGQYCRIRIQFPDVVVRTAKAYHKGKVNASDLGKLRDIIDVIPYIPVKSNYMNHFLGLCFPSVCTFNDIEQLVQLIPFPGKSTVERCEVKKEAEVDNTQLILICLFVLLIVLIIISSFIDWLTHTRKEDKPMPKLKRRCVSVCSAFSVCRNTKTLMQNVEEDCDSLLRGQSVQGVVVASVAWVILGHTYLYPAEEYYMRSSSLSNLRDYWDTVYFTFIVNYQLAVDALLVCYGFIFTFTLWYSTSKSQDVNIPFFRLIIKNYIRLCLPTALCLGVITILPSLGSGPFWSDLLQGTVNKCRSNAGAYLGMYANVLDVEDQCFPHLWFTSCMAQLMLMGLVLCWILSKNLKMGVLITLLVCIAFNGVVAILTFNNKLPPSYVAYFTEESTSYFWRLNMALPFSHFGPYASGLLAGILVARRENHRSRLCTGVIGWTACIVIICGLMLLLHHSRDGSTSPYYSALYGSLSRTMFGVCVAWVLVACPFGIGGFANSILSWKVFDPLFRLSYYAYIFHVIVITYTVSVSREHFEYSHMELILRTVSYIVVTYFISYLMFLLLEMPLKSLQLTLCPKTSSRIEVTPLNNFKKQAEGTSKNTVIQGQCKLWSITETSRADKY